jgi:CRP-like cAMP-binding protein
LRRIDAHMRASGRVVALLQRVEMLAPLPLATITQLAASASPEEAAPGTIVVQEGSRGDDFYVIAEGHAEILTDGVTVGHLGPEDCFGEIAALGGTPRVSTVRSSTHLRLLRFNGPHFVRAVTGYTPSSVAASTLVNERLAQRSSTIIRGVRYGPPQPPVGPKPERPSDTPNPGTA